MTKYKTSAFRQPVGVAGSIPVVLGAKHRFRSAMFTLFTVTLLSLLIASTFSAAKSGSSRTVLDNAETSAEVGATSQMRKRFSGVAPMETAKWFSPSVVPLTLAPDSVATYEVVAGACTSTPKTAFALGEEVCLKASAPLGPGYPVSLLAVIGTDGTAASIVDVNTDPQELVFTLPSTNTSVVNGLVVDNRGTWRASINDRFDFSGRAASFFSVTDPDNAAADLVVFNNSTAAGTITPGDPTGFLVDVINQGPDTAADVHVTQNVPSNMTFDSATAGVGVSFTCAESSGVVDCTPSGGSLASGAFSAFTLNYTVNPGAPNAILTTEADVTSTTTDPQPGSNASSTRIEIRAAGSSPPTCVLGCPLNMTVGANTTQSGNPGAIVNFAGSIESSGDCGTVTSSPASGFFGVGTTTVNVSSATGGGSCSFTITVVETAAPTIDCADNQTGTASGSSNEASVTVNPPEATGTNVVVTGLRNDNRSLSDGYPVGTTTITWTARECNNPPDCDDPNARSASCTQLITVTSADAPTISCPANQSFTAETCDGKTLTSSDIGSPTTTGSNVTVAGQRSDNLDLYSDPYPVGITVITWTVTDDGGRQASCSQTISISGAGDTTDPIITAPPNVTVATDACGQIVGETQLGTPDASDDCGTPNVARTGVPTGNFFPTGTTTITYTATDGAGNTATATQTVTVTESINPTITAPAGLTVHTGAGATSCDVFVGDATLGTASANDNCPGVTVSRTGVPAGNNFPLGTTTILYTATDRSGNTATDTQTVTVIDNTAPTITPPADTTLYTGPGATSCSVTVSDLNAALGTGSATDNCPNVGAVTRSGVPAGNTFQVGTVYTIVYSATDANGNVGSANQTVTVIDNTNPVLALNGNSTMTVECHTAFTDPGATASDNCAGDITGSITVSGSVNINVVGDYTLTYSVDDGNGNSASAQRVVQVRDTTAPVITVNSFSPSLWPPNHKYTTFQLTQFVTSASDSCDVPLGLGNVVIEKVTSDETENGGGDGNTLNDIVIASDCKSVQLRSERNGGGNGRVYTITFRVTDASGNVGRATAKVKVPHNNGANAVEDAVQHTVNGTCP